MAARIAAAVRERVEAAMRSEAVQKTIEARLREERAKLEDKVACLCHTSLLALAPHLLRAACQRRGPLRQVTAQLEAEKAALLARKRAQQAERKRKQEDLERILQDNRRKARRLSLPSRVRVGMVFLRW